MRAGHNWPTDYTTQWLCWFPSSLGGFLGACTVEHADTRAVQFHQDGFLGRTVGALGP